MVFGQFLMKNFYPNNLTIVVDSAAQTLFTLKKIKVKYKDGTDTLFNIKYLKKSIFQNAFGTATHKIYKNQDDSGILIDIGYKDIIFHKKVIFEISSPSALNFVSSTTQIFSIKITGDNIITVGTPILQTGHLIMKKI